MRKSFIIFGLLYCLARMVDTTTDQQPTDGPISECALLKELCKIKYLNASPQVFNYELSNEQIDQMCSKLEKADACFAVYTNSCTVPTDYLDKLAKDHLGLVMQMCHNETYKQDYQAVKVCQKGLRSDYVQCEVSSKNHTKAVTDQIKQIMIVNQSGDLSTEMTQIGLEICCTIYKFRNCTNKRSLDKCGPEATQFANYSFEIYNRDELRNCAKYSRDLMPICVQNIF